MIFVLLKGKSGISEMHDNDYDYIMNLMKHNYLIEVSFNVCKVEGCLLLV